jgi:hypothetical protein
LGKNVAKRPRRNQGGRREEICPPGAATGASRRLRNKKVIVVPRSGSEFIVRAKFRLGKVKGEPVGKIVAWHEIAW